MSACRHPIRNRVRKILVNYTGSYFIQWASYQIRKIAVCACAGNVFPATSSQRSRHASRRVRRARAVMHAGIANYLFPSKSICRGKRFRHSWCMRNPQIYVSDKRPMESWRQGKFYEKHNNFAISLAMTLNDHVYSPCKERPPVLRYHIIQWSFYTGFTQISVEYRFPWDWPPAWYVLDLIPDAVQRRRRGLVENVTIPTQRDGRLEQLVPRQTSVALPSGIVTTDFTRNADGIGTWGCKTVLFLWWKPYTGKTTTLYWIHS